MKRPVAIKLALLLLTASLLPLAFFGVVSIWQARKATIVSVTEGHTNVSRRAASEIQQYLTDALEILEATAENINNADLKDWQKERILKNYINRFDQFHEISVRDIEGRTIATSRINSRDMNEWERRGLETAKKGQRYLSPVFIMEDLTPAMVVTIPLHQLAQMNGALFAEINLLHMWYLVDSIRIGRHGVLHVIDEAGRLIATGDGERKKDVFQGSLFQSPSGNRVIAIGTKLEEPVGWTVMVEQPISEAYALATKISYLLVIVMGGMILIAISLGIYGGRRYVVRPIQSLLQATDELSLGHLDYRVSLTTRDEFSRLAQGFNDMAGRLKELQEKLIREEKHALFGRVAAGLAHDLKHPIQAIENVSRLMERLYEDPAFRGTFRKTVEREFEKINHFLQDLHHLTHDLPYRPIVLSIQSVLAESLATFEEEARKNGIEVKTEMLKDEPIILGDPFTLNRVFSNLISNALQAMNQGGRLTLRVLREDGMVRIDVQDTGMGIPEEQMKSLFEDFVTTKRRGLGLGLAITRKIVLQHRGTIEVESQVGQGTLFTLRFPIKEV